MTKGQALHSFFSGFDIPTYPTTNVPDDAAFPWMTYELITDTWEGGEVGITVNLWYYTESEAIPNAKAKEISESIGSGGIVLDLGGGEYIWLKRGTPWCQSLADSSDNSVKRRYINVTAEYLTLN